MIYLNVKINLTCFHFRGEGIAEDVKQIGQNQAEILQQSFLLLIMSDQLQSE